MDNQWTSRINCLNPLGQHVRLCETWDDVPKIQLIGSSKPQDLMLVSSEKNDPNPPNPEALNMSWSLGHYSVKKNDPIINGLAMHEMSPNRTISFWLNYVNSLT